MTITSFEDLKAWQSCRDLRIWTKDIVRTWPREEKFNLTGQVIRSVRSACANLAEGYGRNNSKDNGRFCKMDIGSLYETLNHFIDAQESGYIDEVILNEGRERIETAIKLTRGYLRYLSSDSTLWEPIAHYGNDPDNVYRTTDNT
jgi:four helix bundle protein